MSEQPDPPQNPPAVDDPSLGMPNDVPEPDSPIDVQNVPAIEEAVIPPSPVVELPTTNIEGVKNPGRLRKLAAGLLVAISPFMGGISAADAAPIERPDPTVQSVESTVPTQRDVASIELGGVSIGLEGDANGLFNTREPVDIPNNQYEKDGLIDQIGGLPNLVIGVPDPTADGAPKGDGWIAEHTETDAESGRTIITHSTKEVEKKTPITKIVTSEKVVTGEESGNTQYERDFETDSSTFDQALTPAEKVAQETLALIEDGYSVSSVKITGKASGEDHTIGGDDANIGEPSENNQRLAAQRAAHGETALNQALDDAQIDTSGAGLSIAGVEIEPTPEQTQKLQSAADSLGITVNELTERFNTLTGNFSPEQISLLSETLTNNRGVMYEIHVSKQESVPTGEFKTTIVKVPSETITRLGGSEEKGDWLLRIEIPGEILLLLAGLAAVKAASRIPLPPGSTGPGGTPPVVESPPRPLPPKAKIPKGGGRYTPPGTKPPKNPPVVDGPPKDEELPFPRPRNQPLPRQRYDRVPVRRKQPREFNFGKDASNLRGGPGKADRDRGGSKSGRR